MSDQPSPAWFRQPRALALVAGTIVLFILLIRTGWAAEDSYISFRVVENFLSGYGLTWNPGERVQVYTDPLFVFLVIAGTWISGNVYWSSVVISLLLTLGEFHLIVRRQSAAVIALGTAILISSKAFMDFSVSGMENPATNLGIAAFCWAYWRKRDPFLLTFIASLTAVNRQDSILLFLPALLLAYYEAGWKAWRAVLLGITPLVAWEIFSLFYYGFLFPNTAYAKLGSGIDSRELMQQGIRYLGNAWEWDRVTLPVIAGAVVLGILVGEWALALGVVLGVAYVVRVGGDFMSGRFLCAPLVLSCAILVRNLPTGRYIAVVAAACVLLVGLSNPKPTLLTTSEYGVNQPLPFKDGIADERSFFYDATGLLRWRKGARWPDTQWADVGYGLRGSGQKVAVVKVAGVIPYCAGPGVHAIDLGALGDALLARLPPISTERRPGHYFRDLPAGYQDSYISGTNRLQDRNLAEYFDHLKIIVSGSLSSTERLKEIFLMNTGYYNHLLPAGSAHR